jgi:hypothetical protein
MPSNGYPKLPLKAWRDLRSRAASAPSTKFTATTVAALMGMASPTSAANNTVRPMRGLGLIDEDGALTPRGNKWRLDASYGEVCQEILDNVYPEDLLALTNDDGEPELKKVRAWFDHKGYGDSNARQMAATYVMIATKKWPDAASSESLKGAQKATAPKKASSPPKVNKAAKASESAAVHAELSTVRDGGGPNVHLDIQIHIPADASPEQIDHIFESMARHLYSR